MTRYKAYYSTYRPIVECVEFDRETEKCLFINGSRWSKKTVYYEFFENKSEAIEAVSVYMEKYIKQTKETVKRYEENYKEFLEEVKG